MPTIFYSLAVQKYKKIIDFHRIFLLNNYESRVNTCVFNSYAKRMCKHIKHENSVLLGVSFGGILVQEMSKHMTFRKLFVVSSVKTRHELPKRFKLIKTTKAYKVLPTQLLGSIDSLAKYSFGNTINKRIDLYKRYLSVNDKRYLDWAIKQVVCWNQDKPISNVIHIHGNKDLHIMIINKFKWFNENLPKLILEKM